MEALTFPGRYQDQTGTEAIRWRITGSCWHEQPSLDFSTTILGVDLRGPDFDGLEPVNPGPPTSRLSFNQAGELTDCVLSGDLPGTVAVSGDRYPVTIAFTLELRRTIERPLSWAPLTLSLALDNIDYQVRHEWFEGGVQRLEQALPPTTQLVCCVTCLFSDYSPYGHGLTGMRCHRGSKDQYLAVRSKADYWSVPVTEEVPETYLCDEYQRRIPGTGYRG